MVLNYSCDTYEEFNFVELSRQGFWEENCAYPANDSQSLDGSVNKDCYMRPNHVF